MMNKIVLASLSPRRKQLLEWAEIAFDIIVEPTDETFPSDFAPEEAAVYIALQKALAVKEKIGDVRAILAADTMVVLDNRIIGKPTDKKDAVNILMQLQNNTHKVITGVAITKGGKQTIFSDITEVSFYELTREQVEFYVDKYQPYDKAGAYAIQEWIGVVGIQSINGDFYNVMGLPVSRVARVLANM